MNLSRSGARIQGDDYQHLFAWYHALRALKPDEDVTGIGIESEDAGNVDDLVVRRAQTSDEYYQVKYSVDATKPINNDWWFERKVKTGKTPLERFWESWQRLRQTKARPPHLALYTNRPLDQSNALLVQRDGRQGTLGTRLHGVSPNSDAGKALQAWANHLKTTPDALLEMLDNFSLLTDQGPWSDLITRTADRMAAVGLRSDELAIEQGCAIIRNWVTSGNREISRKSIRDEVMRRQLEEGECRATLCIQAIDHGSWPDEATIPAYDWVDLFQGNEPKNRRQLQNPDNWNLRLFPSLKEAESQIRRLGFNRVFIRGFMRLPLWFATGVAFSDTRGMQVSCRQKATLWSTDVRPADYQIDVRYPAVSAMGPDIAVGLSVANDLGEEVADYIQSTKVPVCRFANIVSHPQPNTAAIADAASAMGWALQVRNAVRTLARETGARKIHLFLSGPAGGALFLGHIWNRVPETQLYEDLSPGYAPTILIP